MTIRSVTTLLGVLDVTTHYYEFIPEAEIDSPQPTVLGAHELRAGAVLYPADDGLWAVPLQHLRPGALHGLLQPDAAGGVPEQGLVLASVTGEKLSSTR